LPPDPGKVKQRKKYPAFGMPATAEIDIGNGLFSVENKKPGSEHCLVYTD